MEQECKAEDLAMIDFIINAAITTGAGIYNAGHHLGCYKIYEGAGFQILYRLEDRCPKASDFMMRALQEASTTRNPGQYSSVAGNQAWIMRVAFDSMSGARGVQADTERRADDGEQPDETGT